MTSTRTKPEIVVAFSPHAPSEDVKRIARLVSEFDFLQVTDLQVQYALTWYCREVGISVQAEPVNVIISLSTDQAYSEVREFTRCLCNAVPGMMFGTTFIRRALERYKRGEGRA